MPQWHRFLPTLLCALMLATGPLLLPWPGGGIACAQDDDGGGDDDGEDDGEDDGSDDDEADDDETENESDDDAEDEDRGDDGDDDAHDDDMDDDLDDEDDDSGSDDGSDDNSGKGNRDDDDTAVLETGSGGTRDDDDDAAGREYEPDVVLAIDLTRSARRKLRLLGFRIVDEERFDRLGMTLSRLETPGGTPPREAVEWLREVDPDGLYDTNDLYRMAQGEPCSGIRCDAQQLIGWPQTGCPAVVRIGVLDSGVTEDDRALPRAQLVQLRVAGKRSLTDDDRHGSAVAGILIGLSSEGYAALLPSATLASADVFERQSDGGSGTRPPLIARGLNWLLEQQVDVINASIAGPDNAILHEVVRRTTAAGVPVVAAAGNAGPRSPALYPAGWDEAIAVTAVDVDGGIYARAVRGAHIDIAAPGVRVWSSSGDGVGRFVDGTSFAAPFVSAAAALARQREPGLTPAQIGERLQAEARDLGAPGVDPVFGAGLLRWPDCGQARPRDLPASQADPAPAHW